MRWQKMAEKDDFIYPKGKYHGEYSPQNMVFDANLQEFAQRIGIICALENGGKISPRDAYDQIKIVWKELKVSKRNLLDAPEENLDPPAEQT
jgi:hypothetical protein